MNKKVGNINRVVLFAVLLLLSGAATAQVHVEGRVFGGGNLANVGGSTLVNVTQPNNSVDGDVYGGGALADVGTDNTNTTTVNILHGTMGGDIYGGGLGDDDHAAAVNGKVTVNIGALTGALENGFAPSSSVTGNATIIGRSVYGCNNANGTPKDDVTVHIYKTAHTEGNTVPGTDYAILQVFGGGNRSHYEPISEGKKTTVHVWTCDNTIQYLYGGGNAADVGNSTINSATNVIIDGGRIEWVFGGGNGHSETGNHTNPDEPNYNPGANIFGNVTSTFHAGYITYFFGGSNELGEIIGQKTIAVLNDGPCIEENHHIVELYSGNNKAPINNNVGSTLIMPCLGNDPCQVDYIFGGSRDADISGDVELTLIGGKYNYVFGGNNLGGTITGNVTLNLYGGIISQAAFGGNKGGLDEHGVFHDGGSITGNITVNVEDQCDCPLSVNDVFGAGDLAKYEAPTGTGAREFNPMVNVNHICPDSDNTIRTILGNVYGAGNGTTDSISQRPGMVTGNPKVTIGDLNNAHIAAISGNVYGGGNAAKVVGATTVLMQNANSKVYQNIFGGGNLAHVTDSTVVDINNGVVTLDVYGGGAFADTDGSNVTLGGGTVRDIYGGGLGRAEESGVEPIEAQVTGPVRVAVNSGTVRDVYGCNNVNGAPTDTVRVDINSNVTRNVYGGGNLALCTLVPAVYINNGTIGGSVFGGGNEAGVGGGYVNMINGTVQGGGVETGGRGGVFGGCNTSGNVNGDIIVTITGGTIGADGTAANVHGGGYGNLTSTSGDVNLTINRASGENPPADPVIWGDVYGGSALGNVNTANGSDQTNITLEHGTIHGNLYGGGLGSSDHPAAVNGAVQVTVNGGTITEDVYGCNNVSGAPQSTVKVDINATDPAPAGSDYALRNVFGGGNMATYGGTPAVTIHNCGNSIGYVYGGGNKAGVDGTNVVVYGGNTIGYVFAGGNGLGMAADYTMVTGNAVANIYGGTIGKVFGGNNNSGYIEGNSFVNVDKQTESGHESCLMKVGEVYGGGNLAAGKAGTIDIDCTGTWTTAHNTHNTTTNRIGYELEGIGTVYGGANEADIEGNIKLDIYEGIIDSVFGGNNKSGVIGGTIQVNIDSLGVACSPNWYVGDVFGGGNHAPYNGTPDVNMKKGTVYRSVFGGGNDITADSQSNPAGVAGSDVEMTGGTVLLGVYGGCNKKGSVINDSQVKVTGGIIGSQERLNDSLVAGIFGGGLGEDTKVKGDVTVTIDTANATSPTIYGDVYGGSALGEVNTNGDNTTTVNIYGGTFKTRKTTGTSAVGQPVNIYTGGNIYGGGLGDRASFGGDHSDVAAKVNGKVFVNIGTGTLGSVNPDTAVVTNLRGDATIKGNVYGCNNVNGSPQEDVMVNVFKTAHSATDSANYIGTPPSVLTFAIANVFGGGNKADFTVAGKTATVNIYTCDNTIERTFSGGNAAATNSVRTMIQGGRIHEVYGGGNGEVTPADVHGTVTLDIHGGDIWQSYAGSNQQGTIFEGSTVHVDDFGPCTETTVSEFFCGGNYADFIGDINASITCSEGMQVDNLYGGCNQAQVLAGNGGSGNVNLTVWGGNYKNIYGGSKGRPEGDPLGEMSADIAGDVTLNIYGGSIGEAVYGGCNIKGLVHGNITVTVIDSIGDACGLDAALCDVYGGGNLAEYVAPTGNGAREFNPIVNIRHATVRNVFGGGKGDPADNTQMKGSVTGTPKVTIGDDYDPHRAVVNQSVYGGGNAAKIIGNPWVVLKSLSKVYGNVYGGGNMGVVEGSTKVIVNGKVVE